MIIMIGGQWYRVPDIILKDQTLTRSDIAVFAIIADRADGDFATISSAELSDLAGCCVRTVKSATKHLAERGYISIQRAAGGASSYKQLLLEPKRRKGSKRSQGAKDDYCERYKDELASLVNNFDVKEVG